jgi:alpha-N-arabinofuranosidase
MVRRHTLTLTVLIALPTGLAKAGPAPAPPADAKLANPGFDDKLQGWFLHVYGAPSRVESDRKVVREGKCSLRISASQPSDTALGQEILLQAGQCYRLSGWVRTRGLNPRGAPVFGTFQVQHSGGQGILATGTNHAGDTPWTKVVLHFVAPPSGRVRIGVFFVGFGKGTGTAWFDGLELKRVDLSHVPARISRTFLFAEKISPLQYGQFMEYLCDLVPGMWAEKLYDGSFEGLSPYKLVFLKETDFKEKPWYPSGAVNRAVYTKDRTNPVSGKVCQRIAVRPGATCTVGISQDGLAVERGKACVFTCYLRQQGLERPVQVQLRHEGRGYATAEFRPAAAWKKFRARLVPSHGDAAATLTISFRGPGTLWLDNASLMPEGTIGGWRPDVVAAVRALKPGIIRFGGSALDDGNLGDFEWRDTIGDPDRRKPFRAWGGLQPMGPGLEEIVQFCRHVGAEPLICVRFSGRTPADAAAQVEYFNGSADTPMGKRRAQNGHPKPYAIHYWQVGNERSGKDYEGRLADFCEAMRKADPSITLLSSYPTAGVLRRAGGLLDMVCPHHYDIADRAGVERDLARIRALVRTHTPRRSIKVAVTEWNTTAGDAGPRRARLWTLENALACARYHNLLHRHGELVVLANRSNLTNSFCSGIIQTDNHRLFKTPTYYAQQLYATLAGDRPLRIASAVPADLAPDLSATLSAGGDALILFAVNDTLRDVTRPLDFSAFGSKGQELEVWTLTDRQRAGEPDIANSFAEPERVAPVTSRFRAASARFAYRFPALSLTVLRWRVRK